MRLEEHSGGGYLWDIEQLKASGLAVVRDEREALDSEAVGGPVLAGTKSVSVWSRA